ncbi:MAG: hypothetical protein ABIP80_00285 [Ferruginibacter sp.]
MKITNRLLSFTLPIALLFFTGCSKNKDSASEIEYQLQTTNRSTTIAKPQTGNIVWTSGYVFATKIKLEAELNNQEIEYESSLAQRIDLFSTVTPLGSITLPPGTYSEVEFEIELNPTATDAALELNGQYTSGGISTPVVFRVTTPLELKNEKDNVVVTYNNSYNALTTIDLSLITRNITENMLNAAVRTNGKILITSTINSNIYNILLSNLHESDEVEFEDD